MNRDEALRAASNHDWSVRASAVQTLVDELDEAESSALATLLCDENLAVIQAAAQALLGRGDSPALTLFTDAYNSAVPQSGDVLNDVLRSAQHEHPEAIDGLEEVAASGDDGARAALAWLRE